MTRLSVFALLSVLLIVGLLPTSSPILTYMLVRFRTHFDRVSQVEFALRAIEQLVVGMLFLRASMVIWRKQRCVAIFVTAVYMMRLVPRRLVMALLLSYLTKGRMLRARPQ